MTAAGLADTRNAVRATSYTAAAKWLHWSVALGIVVAFAMGWVMTRMPGISIAKLRYFNWHKWLGVTVFAVALVRIACAMIWRAPALPATLSRFERVGSHVMHYALYVATLFVPLSGYFYTLAAGYPVVYFTVLELPVLYGKNVEWMSPLKAVHAWSSYVMAIAVLFHAAAAFVHHFCRRDTVLTRMLPSRRSVKESGVSQ